MLISLCLLISLILKQLQDTGRILDLSMWGLEAQSGVLTHVCTESRELCVVCFHVYVCCVCV